MTKKAPQRTAFVTFLIGLDAPKVPIEPYMPLRDCVMSKAFSDEIKMPPNRLRFLREGRPLEDDSLLYPEDEIAIEGRYTEKGAISPQEIIAKLESLVGLRFLAREKAHDLWATASGTPVRLPNTAGAMVDRLPEIIRSAGLDMSIEEFVSPKLSES